MACCVLELVQRDGQSCNLSRPGSLQKAPLEVTMKTFDPQITSYQIPRSGCCCCCCCERTDKGDSMSRRRARSGDGDSVNTRPGPGNGRCVSATWAATIHLMIIFRTGSSSLYSVSLQKQILVGQNFTCQRGGVGYSGPVLQVCT